MAQIEIYADRIKTIRKARKIGRPKLAKLAALTERQLTKIETSDTAMVSTETVTRLSQALQISAMTLTGEFSVTQEDLQPAAKSSCTTGCCG